MKTVWVGQCWRQQLTSAKQLHSALQEAQRLGFTHYHVLRSGHQYWLSCVELGAPCIAFDRLAYIKHELSTMSSAMVLYVSACSLFWVVWREAELVVADEIELADLMADSVFELIQFHYQKLPIGSAAMVFGELPEALAKQFKQAEIALKFMTDSATNVNECRRRYGFVPLTRPPRAVWLKRGVITMSLALVTGAVSLGWNWQQLTPTPPIVQPAQLWQPAGVAMAALPKVVEFAQHSEQVAGWQLQTAELTAAGQLQAQSQATYGRYAELPLLISSHWQITGTDNTARWVTQLTPDRVGEQWWLHSDNVDFSSNGQQFLQQHFISAVISAHDQGSNESWTWQDWQLQWQPIFWDELVSSQWPITSPIRLLSFHYQPAADYRLTMVIRIYQRVISTAESSL